MLTKKTEDKRHNTGKVNTGGRLAAAVLLLLFSGAGMLLSAYVPDFAQWYAVHIYPVLVTTIGRVWGWFPFSVSEILIYILLLTLVVTMVRMIVKTVLTRRTRAAVSWISGVLLTAGILAFLYTACCGINYHRKSFSEEEGIVTYEYRLEQLRDICVWLTEEVNSRADEVTRNAEGVMELDAPEGSGAVESMNRLGEEFPSVRGYYPQPKKLLISEILSYQSLSGIYLPFTVEANFIAFLACVGSERADFQYSGYLSGWVYCMNALYRADYETWQEVRVRLDEAVEPDLEANNAFWDRYEGPVSETAERINDTYLKVNGQADGVERYDRMVDLIVAYFGEQ